jgi:hypothetical protein
LVEVPVTKAFTHEGRAFAVGETIVVSPIEAAALHRRGLVSLTRGYVAPVPRGSFKGFGKGTPPPDVSTDPPKRRTRRRDLESASTDEPTATPRRYRRRDLTPES